MSKELMNSRAWWHVNAISVAFMVGYMEQAMLRDHKIIPRYIEDVSRHVAEAITAEKGDIVFMSPNEVSDKLYKISNRHYVVIEWGINRREACRKAGEYLMRFLAEETLLDSANA